MKYKDYIKEYKDFPIDGINYLDLNPIYKNGHLLKTITEDCLYLIKDFDFEYIGLVESRGFILGSIIAHQLGKLATGGTAKGSIEVLKKAGYTPTSALFLVELDFLKPKLDVLHRSIIHYE